MKFNCLFPHISCIVSNINSLFCPGGVDMRHADFACGGNFEVHWSQGGCSQAGVDESRQIAEKFSKFYVLDHGNIDGLKLSWYFRYC